MVDLQENRIKFHAEVVNTVKKKIREKMYDGNLKAELCNTLILEHKNSIKSKIKRQKKKQPKKTSLKFTIPWRVVLEIITTDLYKCYSILANDPIMQNEYRESFLLQFSMFKMPENYKQDIRDYQLYLIPLKKVVEDHIFLFKRYPGKDEFYNLEVPYDVFENILRESNPQLQPKGEIKARVVDKSGTVLQEAKIPQKKPEKRFNFKKTYE